MVKISGNTGIDTVQNGKVMSNDLETSIALTGTPTAPTAATGDSSTLLATTAFVHNVVGATPTTIGVGQTWQNLSGTRTIFNVAYANTTGKPIMVNVSYFNGEKAGHVMWARALGSTSWILIGDAGDRDFGGSNVISAIIPNNWEYYITWHGDTWENVWAELR
jgi:hypothetical protein